MICVFYLEPNYIRPGNVLTSMTAYRPVTFSMMTSMPNRSRPNICWSLIVRLRSLSASGLNIGCCNSLSTIFTGTQSLIVSLLWRHHFISHQNLTFPKSLGPTSQIFFTCYQHLDLTVCGRLSWLQISFFISLKIPITFLIFNWIELTNQIKPH